MNWKGTSEMGSECGENIYTLTGSGECPGQLFGGIAEKRQENQEEEEVSCLARVIAPER